MGQYSCAIAHRNDVIKLLILKLADILRLLWADIDADFFHRRHCLRMKVRRELNSQYKVEHGRKTLTAKSCNFKNSKADDIFSNDNTKAQTAWRNVQLLLS